MLYKNWTTSRTKEKEMEKKRGFGWPGILSIMLPKENRCKGQVARCKGQTGSQV